MHAIQKLKAHSLPICFFDKIDSPFCLQNCFFLLAAHFAQILLSKFCQGLNFRHYRQYRNWSISRCHALILAWFWNWSYSIHFPSIWYLTSWEGEIYEFESGKVVCFTRLPTLHHIQMTCYSLTVHTLNLQLKVVALDSFQVVDSVLRYLETQSRMESYRWSIFEGSYWARAFSFVYIWLNGNIIIML